MSVNQTSHKVSLNSYAARASLTPNDAGGANRRQPYEHAPLSAYSFKQRLLIKTLDLIFFVLISVLGKTIRFEVEGWEHWQSVEEKQLLPIYAFWHNRIFLATYFWQRRGIVVMTSQSFDGEYIARFIQRFGYGTARGSTTRGGTGALIEMIRLVRSGKPAAFTVDGPKGPKERAQAGAVLLAKKTGCPLLPFTVNVSSYWQIASWDKLQIPKPFACARVTIAAPIYVASDAKDDLIELKRNELQTALDAISK